MVEKSMYSRFNEHKPPEKQAMEWTKRSYEASNHPSLFLFITNQRIGGFLLRMEVGSSIIEDKMI